MHRLICALFLFSIFLFAPGAQENVIMDTIIDSKGISVAEAAWLVGNAAEAIPDTANTAEAAQLAQKAGWPIADSPEKTPVVLGDYCVMLMRAFKLNGGIFWSIAGSSRYALRELTYLKAVHSPSWVEETVSGEDALRILQKAMDLREKQK